MTHLYRLFVASPGDVTKERETLQDVIDEVNRTHGEPLDYRLELLRWETDAAPGGGRPQQVINDEIGSYDIFVGIMWRRFGTPTGMAGSGTEEEYQLAYRAWEQNPGMPLLFYFCQKPFMPQSIEELEQMKQVLLFRRELEGKSLVWNYDRSEEFPQVIRKHICLRMNRLAGRASSEYTPQPDDASIRVLRDLWGRMTPELQRAFNIAYNERRGGGNAGVQTKDLFAALMRVQAKQLQRIVAEIPPAALPAPTEGHIVDEPYIVQERPWLSYCVAASMDRLQQQLPKGRELTSADVFADIAKHGSDESSSVRLLRDHNIGPQEMENILKRKHVRVLAKTA